MAKQVSLITAVCLSLSAFAATYATTDSKAASSRLVSFAPSNTELIYSIGAGDKLVGVCSYCDYPGSVKRKPLVGNFISANLERLAGLKPDKVVLVSGQEALAAQLSHNGYKTAILRNDRLSDISKNLKELAATTGGTTRGEQAAKTLDTCLQELKNITSKASAKPSAFYCVWPQPLLTIGKASYLTEAITICGGDSISKTLEAGYPHFSLEKLVLANPELIVLPYECKDREFLTKHPWSTLKAVKKGHVYFLPPPSEDGLARPTLRITNGLYWLAKKVHPELSSSLDAWFTRTHNSLNSFSDGAPTNLPTGSKQPSPK